MLPTFVSPLTTPVFPQAITNPNVTSHNAACENIRTYRTAIDAGRDYTHYALIAGYTEIGETLEQTVSREVMEEVGLKVKNIRFYKSQPWGIDGGLLLGFFCDLDGSDAITLDENELSVAQWHQRHALPIDDDGYSLTREMIRVFGEGKEPR